MAAYYFEITSPIYEINQHFESFKMVHNFKFCRIPFNKSGIKYSFEPRILLKGDTIFLKLCFYMNKFDQ